ncbi:MAG: glycosyltransferase family 39 protein [Patescibacteria group bacterium]
MKKSLVLILLFIASFLIRIYQIGQLPSILNRDETALAYNAYLLKETGHDEWGKSWPLSLESFGDYKLSGYVYSLVGLFQVLPLKDWVVKLPSVLAGSALVILAFFFAKAVKFRKPWAWLFAILIATTPVFFFYSRIAFEANLALTLFVSALVLLLSKAKGKKRLIFDLLAIILVLFSAFTYNTPLLLLPFILPIIIWLRGFKLWKKWLFPIVGLSIVIIIAGYQLMSLSAQKSGITIFQDETSWTNSVVFRQQFSGAWQTILGNKYVYYSYLISQNYLKSFSPAFLINANNGHPWHSLPNHGHLFGIVYFFGIIGILSIIYELLLAIKNCQFSNTVKVRISLLYLLLISLFPAVVTVDAPHATRSLLFFFLFNFFTLFGLKKSYHFIRDHTQIKKNALFISFSLILIISSWRYFGDYFQNYPKQQQSLKPGFKQVISQVNQQYPDKKIVVIDEEGYQYILLAWYLKITPEQFFGSTIRQLPDKIGFRYGEQVARYHFIADIDDRNQEEKIIINWNKIEKKWEILEF